MSVPTIINKGNMQSVLGMGLLGLVAYGFAVDKIGGDVIAAAFGAVMGYFFNRAINSK